MQRKHACPLENTSLYSCMSLRTCCGSLGVQFVTSIKANLYTQQRITLLTSTNHNCTSFQCIFKWNTSVDWSCMSDSLTFSVPPLPTSKLFVCVCGVFLSNKSEIRMWLSYSKPTVCIRQRQNSPLRNPLCFTCNI